MNQLKNRLLLVDFYNLLIRNFAIVPITNDNGEHFGGTFGFLRSLKAAIDEFKPTQVYVITDGPQSALRRKMIDENYKAGRRKEWKRGTVKAYDFLDEQEERDNFSMQIRRLNEYLALLPIKTISIPYVEADDIIAEIVNTMPSDTGAIIYSTDADFKQLVNERVVCYNPMAKQLTTEKSFLEKFGYRADNYIYFKVINGDKSDGLVGVDGIGAKTFVKIYPQLVDKHIEDLDELFEYSRHVIDSKAKTFTKSLKANHQKILDAEELIRRNYQLMQLNDVNISIQSKDLCRECMQSEPNTFNRMKIRMMFITDKLNTQVKSFDEWSRVFSGLIVRSKV